MAEVPPSPSHRPSPGSPEERGVPARPPSGGLGDRADLVSLGGPSPPWWQRLIPAGAEDLAGTPAAWLAAAAVVAVLIGAGTAWALVRTGPPAGDGLAPALPLVTRGPVPGTTVAVEPPPAPGTTAAVTVWVAVTGGVARPGLYHLAPDSRLSALIAAAGGLAVDADPDRINLAATVHDGERVHVPRRGEPGAPAVVAGAGPPTTGPVAPGPAGAGGAPAPPVDVNTASAEELDRLPGIGPATARAIIEHRTTKGPFASVEELADVRGIGPAKLEQLRPLVVVP